MNIRIGLVDVSCVDGVVTWTSGMQVDGDGSPRCYVPLGSAMRGLDALGNAGKPGNWYGLACDEKGEPYLQDHDAPAPGFYVSTTALFDRGLPSSNPRRYVNAEVVPYVAIPPELMSACGVRLGDFAIVERGDWSSGAIVADIGPRGRLGEGSIALAKILRIPESPRNGGVASGVSFTVFAGSAGHPPWPRTGVSSIAREIAKQRLQCS